MSNYGRITKNELTPSFKLELNEIEATTNQIDYQTAAVSGTQIQLQKPSNMSRIFFKLDNDLTGDITISTDGGSTSKNLVDLDGNQLTSLDKGYHEIVAAANFFIIRNKGGLSKTDLEALITIVNEAEANESVLKTEYINTVNATDENINLPSTATWNDILLQIPNIGSSKSEIISLSGTTTAQSSKTYRFANDTGSMGSVYFSINLGFKPSQFNISLRISSNATTSYDVSYQKASDGYYSDVFKLVSNFNGSNNGSATSRIYKAESDTTNFYENGILYVPTLLGAGNYQFSGVFVK